MKQRIEKLVLRKMSAKDFAALLNKYGACTEARKWAKGKTFQKVWKTCDNYFWITWLLWKTADDKGWLTIEQYNHIHTLAGSALYTGEGDYSLKKALAVLHRHITIK